MKRNNQKIEHNKKADGSEPKAKSNPCNLWAQMVTGMIVFMRLPQSLKVVRMRKRYNLVRRLLDSRKYSKDGKLALAVYLGIKFDHTNSIHYGMTAKELQQYYRCGTPNANAIHRIIQEDTELFSCNPEKNVVFANGCKSDEVKHSRGRVRNEYRGDDVISIEIHNVTLTEAEGSHSKNCSYSLTVS